MRFLQCGIAFGEREHHEVYIHREYSTLTALGMEMRPYSFAYSTGFLKSQMKVKGRSDEEIMKISKIHKQCLRQWKLAGNELIKHL